jgi:hypothetical protein
VRSLVLIYLFANNGILLSARGLKGWIRSPENAARWGEDYITRAQAAWFAPHINTIEEAVYLIQQRYRPGRNI